MIEDSIGVLNVGAGDIRLRFDKANMQERLRAARIVKDMIRRGSAILIEVEIDGVKSYQRALDFDENVCEYIIADYVSAQPLPPDQGQPIVGQLMEVTSDGEGSETEMGASGKVEGGAKRKTKLRRIPAEHAKGIAVARSAGG